MHKKIRVMAMDLGTSNTCIAACNSDINDGKVTVIKPDQWQNPALGGAIPTLVLYKDEQPFLIGAAAEYEFGEAGEEERKQYSLRSQFKPDVAVNDAAKQCMLDFLRLLRERVPLSPLDAIKNQQSTQSYAHADNLHEEGHENDMASDIPHTAVTAHKNTTNNAKQHTDTEHGRILVGIPSQAENHYQQVLRQCLHDTGWHNAQFLREPMGALLHYIASGALPPSVAAKGVLTVDFGGGTCDFAYLRRADVVGRHGDMLYGGRLFDDLFYQILLEHNHGLEQQLRKQNNMYYVHWVACRRAKEEFSAAMHKNREQSITIRVRWSYFDGKNVQECSAYIENFTWAQFMERAGRYVASEEFLLSLQEHGHRAGLSPRGQGLLQGKQTDLVSWFEDAFLETLKNVRSAPETEANLSPLADKPLILLTGGSSAWPFVLDVVRQTLGQNSKILIGDEPYADIAKGLAQYDILAAHLREGREALQTELPSFMNERIRRHGIERILENGSQMLMQDMGDFLRNVVLMPEFRRYREEGGSLSKLMEGIAKSLMEEEKRIQDLLDTAMVRMGRNIVDACRKELKDWFHEKGIPIVPERLEQTWLAMAMDNFISRMGEELGKSTLSQDRNAAEMATMVAAPGLAALAASGAPITATLLGVSGLVLMKVFNLDKWVVGKVLYVPVPGLLRRRIFSEARLEKLCHEQLKSFGAEFKKQILHSWKESEGHIMAEAARVAGEEIASLDILNITPA